MTNRQEIERLPGTMLQKAIAADIYMSSPSANVASPPNLHIAYFIR